MIVTKITTPAPNVRSQKFLDELYIGAGTVSPEVVCTERFGPALKVPSATFPSNLFYR